MPKHSVKVLTSSAKDLDALARFLSQHELPNLPEIHGLLTAVASAPRLIEPSRWLAALGLADCTYGSRARIQRLTTCVIGLYRDISVALQTQRFCLTKVTMLHRPNTEMLNNQVQWAHGYLLGVTLDQTAWLRDINAIALLGPIQAYELINPHSPLFDLPRYDAPPDESLHDLTQAANAIYRYWLYHRRHPSTLS